MKALRIGLATGAMVALISVASSAHAQATPAPADPNASPTASPSAPAPETPPPAATPAPAASPAAAPAAATTPTTEPPPAQASQRTVWPWIIMGTGIVLVGTAAYFQFKAVSEDDKREDLETELFSVPQGDRRRASLAAEIENHDNDAKSSRTTSLVVGTVGFLAIAGAVVLWFVEGGSSEPAKSAGVGGAKSKRWFSPALAPGYAGAGFGTSF